MELQLNTVRRVSTAAERRMRARVNATLGEWKITAVAPVQLATPSTPRTATRVADPFAVAQATIEAMQRSTAADQRRRDEWRQDLTDAFEKGADVTARRIADVSGDPNYKRFSRTQKGKIMG